jgi:hypothetical protein
MNNKAHISVAWKVKDVQLKTGSGCEILAIQETAD